MEITIIIPLIRKIDKPVNEREAARLYSKFIHIGAQHVIAKRR